MSEIIGNLNKAQEIIRTAISNCSQFKVDEVPSNENSPSGRRGNQYWGIPNDDNTAPGNQYWGIPNDDNTTSVGNSLPDPDVYPVESHTLSIEGQGDIKFASVGGEATFELVELSDGSYQLTVEAGPSASIGIPGTNFGVEASTIAGITYDIDPEQAASLLQDPRNMANLPAELTQNISGLSLTSNLSLGLDTLGIEIPDTIAEKLSNPGLSIPNTDIDLEISHGIEFNKNANGEWEIAATLTGTANTSTTTNETNGWRSWLNTASPVNIEDIRTEGSVSSYDAAMSYNTSSGEFETRITETKTSFEGEGKGLDLDTSLVGPEYTAGVATSGTFNTETIVTTYDANGNKIDTQTTNSSGSYDESSADAFIATSGSTLTNETFNTPESES